MDKAVNILKRLAAAAAAAVISASCSAGAQIPKTTANSGKISIVTTIFPEYDWTRNIIGDSEAFDLSLLVSNGADLHSYQPTADDIIKLSSCDMIIYIGGESDKWIEDALEERTNKDMKIINLMDTLGAAAKEEELKEGMQGEEDEEDTDEPEYDEHIWLSLKNAGTLCSAITDAVCEADPDNSDKYRANLNAYTDRLDALDQNFSKLFAGASQKTLVFGDRFPFRYFTDDYGLDYYAAFIGCSAETEASFETITFLAAKMDALGCSTIFTIENSDRKIAETVIANTSSKDQRIAQLDSMQSVPANKVDSGASYLDIMQKNYDILKESLS